LHLYYFLLLIFVNSRKYIMYKIITENNKVILAKNSLDAIYKLLSLERKKKKSNKTSSAISKKDIHFLSWSMGEKQYTKREELYGVFNFIYRGHATQSNSLQ